MATFLTDSKKIIVLKKSNALYWYLLIIAFLAFNVFVWQVPFSWAASYRGKSAIAASTGADVTVTLPTHVADDIMLLAVVVRDQDDTITWPSGWTELATVDRSTVSRYWWAWKRATSASETNPLVDKSTATGDTYAQVIVFKNAYTSGDPWETVGTPSTGTSDPASVNGISTASDGSLVVAAISGEDDNNASINDTATDPSSFTEQYTESTTGSDGVITFGYATRTSAGATGTVSGDWNTAVPVGWGGVILSLKTAPTTNIYRSVGTTATALATGSGNDLAISGSTATFNSGIANNIGVGDAIQYDSDNNSSIDKVCFIHGRTSSTSFTVKSASGGTPTSTSSNDQDWSIFRAYVSLNRAEAGDENDNLDNAIEDFDTWDGGAGYPDCVGNNYIWNLACYGDGTDTTAADFDWGGGTSASTYVRLFTPVDSSEVGTSQRHTGNFTSSGAYLLQISNGTVLAFANDAMVEGLQIYLAASSADYQKGLHFDTYGTTRTFYLYDTIVRGPASDNDTVWAVNSSDSTPIIYARNNIIYDWEGGGNNGTGIRTANIASGGYAYLYNNTIHACGEGIAVDTTGGVVVAKNNIVQNCTNGYNGSNFIACEYNISDLAADAPGAHSKQSTNVTFVDESNADHALRDFHLDAADTAANDAGLDLSSDLTLAVATDIDGESRPMNSVMDIGADEVTVAGSSRRVFFISSLNLPRLLAIADVEIKKYQLPALRFIHADWKERIVRRDP